VVTPVELAERALLGSLLLQPAQRTGVVGWLLADDFADPWHRDVYAAITNEASGGSVAETYRRFAAAHGPRRSPAARFATLIQSAPDRPVARRYAAMVLEASIRRQVAGIGVLLEAAAIRAASTAWSGREPLDVLDERLVSAERRWHTAQHPQSQQVTAERASTAVDALLGAARLVAATPTPDPARVRDAESCVLSAMLSDPRCLPGIAGRIRPGLFGDPRHRACYEAILDLAERGEPIDIVTVAWQQQHDREHHGPGPVVEDLAGLVALAPPGSPTYLTDRLATVAARRIAADAAEQLRSLAYRLGLDVQDLLFTARLHAMSVRDAIDSTARHEPLATTGVGAVAASARLAPPAKVVALR
jgi:replicative DNA helicase